ncbi:MAG: threonine ammonia-lyase, biosynthetic, partial [Lautropia sp.]|nr:threonine ammonia-lyase, biosynthetic [Lautropia sp.]
MAIDYLKRILNARVYDVAQESPLEPAPRLSARLGNRALIKREDLQPVFSFKVRGAYNKMVNLTPGELSRGVIAASAGNHAQGVALAAARLGCRAVIVMPTTTPQLKIDAVKARGAIAMLYGESFSDAYRHARELQEQEGLTFVHPFDDPDVIAGQGTIGMEILRQHQAPIEAIFVAIGGGGLISGVAAYVKQVRPEIRIIGVQTHDSNAMALSLAAGHVVDLAEVGLFADGTAVKRVGDETFRLCQRFVDEIVLVDTDQICAAIKDVFEDTRAILEPAGALAIAGMKAWVEQTGAAGQTLVAIACGANMNFDRLRFVSERAEVGERREAVFAVTIPEERGSFRRFCELVGPRNVTEFNYRIADKNDAHVFVGMQITSFGEAASMARAFEGAGFRTLDLTADELAKSHLRHLVGGHSELARDEAIYRFEFPERPGALMKFLASMSHNWNISLFHYRNHGDDQGRVLVGMQVPASERDEFDGFLASLGYRSGRKRRIPA